ncbi:AAA family ATPase [Mesorhizobium sp.]|uniref:AAA family ATPase n=1 Tax=Mesorhizobium sp. TaxID=1871066 RepID=UPI000FE33AA5|nr:AAA family ATPase [Mesorhizobium sp.]RWK08507.1 MAG: hypothetical protein EOR42_04415 [Mesorhizobium sp.]
MRIKRLKIQNFKAIREFEIRELSDAVVIAGPNGSGKSCIFDAIRLLKSLYGGYNQDDEWHHFFNEFQLNLNNPDEVRKIFSNPNLPLLIEADFEISKKELEFITTNAASLLARGVWQRRFGRQIVDINNSPDLLDNESKDKIRQISESILASADNPLHTASFKLDPNLASEISQDHLLNFIFGIYDPKNIGVIDFHSPNRSYQRERLGGININIEDSANRMAQHSLYNWQNKYTNIKSELAGAFVRDLLASQAGAKDFAGTSIIETLKELFSTFLPGKRFAGPRPGLSGEISFPIELDTGSEHDIDDLSSGEKELAYGYLRLRNTAPSNSIILLDEPELHLNPRIIVGLPNFYRMHLGSSLHNQIWMVTHSDAFLRDAFKAGGFSLFHMTPASLSPIRDNQAVVISSTSEVDRAVIEMVGDIAGYWPGSKLVLFESSESANFDSMVTKRLFPEFA